MAFTAAGVAYSHRRIGSHYSHTDDAVHIPVSTDVSTVRRCWLVELCQRLRVYYYRTPYGIEIGSSLYTDASSRG